MKYALLFALVLAGCGTSPDPRPVTFEVVAEEILKPSCGLVACHSSTTSVQQYAFDTTDAARAALKRNTAEIVFQIEQQKMPPDSPMSDEDVALIEAWVAAGSPGL